LRDRETARKEMVITGSAVRAERGSPGSLFQHNSSYLDLELWELLSALKTCRAIVRSFGAHHTADARGGK
jgi:hypothetical protein